MAGVEVSIEVSLEAAERLRDPARRKAVGRLVSDILHPDHSVADPLAVLIADIKAAARASELTDEDVDAELSAYNAEGRL